MSKIELSQWQNPEDGFPSGSYFDAVIVALEELGIGVEDSWRNEAWEFAILLDPAEAPVYPLDPWADHLQIGWCVAEESDPLHERDDEELYGFADGVDCAAGWYWLPCHLNGTGRKAHHLEAPLTEPSEVAAAVAALARPSQDQEASTGN